MFDFFNRDHETRESKDLDRPQEMTEAEQASLDDRTKAEKEREKRESLNSLVREFRRMAEYFLNQMQMFQGCADAFSEMSQSQISQVWDSAAAVDMAIIAFSKEVKAIQAENENGGNDNEN